LLYQQVDEEGTLFFNAFEPEKYRSDIHKNSYRCRATNSIGTIISPEIQTTAGKKISSHLSSFKVG